MSVRRTLVVLSLASLIAGCDGAAEASEDDARSSVASAPAAEPVTPGAEPGAAAPADGSVPAPGHVAVQPGAPPSSAQAEPVPRVAWPPTALSLGLLATMDAQDLAQSRATIRDERSGVISSYRPGDHIRPDVEVLAVDNGVVELSNAGEVEYLSISTVPVELSADDVFYPDLVDHLHLSTSMGDGVVMPPGPDYTLKAEAYSWGTPRSIALLRDAIRNYARGRQAPPVHIGDISRRGGGPFPPHLSHHEGRDVDIAYVLHNPDARFGVATERTLDRPRTWALLQALLDSNAVAYVFVDYDVQRLLYEHAQLEGVDDVTLEKLFQFPYGRRASRGMIRHWKGHRDHFHVRFEQ
ncbi:MAG: penicillin-insensitive murein endopeptidase [Deltaproteobacteria bacterium]|nr:penicillin-insensitive murein endopeptidase [Deltaproteobacteria bacterium]